MTIDHWSERFERSVGEIRESFNDRFVRMWRLYLRASSAAVAEGRVELHQILVSNGASSSLPLTRGDIYRAKV
jgi:cyclopropane-fatty-acyl-phospholipid synthase